VLFLDTNICIHFLKGMSASVRERLLATPPSTIKIPVIVEAELLYGAEKSLRKEANLKKVTAFLAPFEVIPFSSDAAGVYARIRADLEIQGNPIGPNNLLIAATVMATGGTLITRNVREFSRVTNLSVMNW